MILSTKSKVTITLALLASMAGASAFGQIVARPAARPAEAISGLKEGRAGEKVGETSELQTLLKRGSISETAYARLAEGAKGTDANTLKATQEFLKIIRGNDAVKKTAALKAINASKDLSGAWATFQAGAGQQVANNAAAESGRVKRTCENAPEVPVGARKIIDENNPVNDCGLSREGVLAAYDLAVKVESTGSKDNKFPELYAKALQARNATIKTYQEAVAGLKVIFFGDAKHINCINGTPGFKAQAAALIGAQGQ